MSWRSSASVRSRRTSPKIGSSCRRANGVSTPRGSREMKHLDPRTASPRVSAEREVFTHRPAFRTTTRAEPTLQHEAAEPEQHAPFPDGRPSGRYRTRPSANDRSQARGFERDLAPCHHGVEAFDTPCVASFGCALPSHAATKRCRFAPRAPVRQNHRKLTRRSFRRRCRDHPRPEGPKTIPAHPACPLQSPGENHAHASPNASANEGSVHRRPAGVSTSRNTGTPLEEQTVPKTRSSVTTTPTLTFHSRSPNVPDVAQ